MMKKTINLFFVSLFLITGCTGSKFTTGRYYNSANREFLYLFPDSTYEFKGFDRRGYHLSSKGYWDNNARSLFLKENTDGVGRIRIFDTDSAYHGKGFIVIAKVKGWVKVALYVDDVEATILDDENSSIVLEKVPKKLFAKASVKGYLTLPPTRQYVFSDTLSFDNAEKGSKTLVVEATISDFYRTEVGDKRLKIKGKKLLKEVETGKVFKFHNRSADGKVILLARF